MSEDAISRIHNVFQINELQTAMLGGTFISLDPRCGAGDAAGANVSTPTVPLDSNQYLNLYPELAELEMAQGNPFECVGLSTMWNVGFTSSNEKLIAPDYFVGDSTKYLKNRRIKTTDQLFSRRSSTDATAFFSCFKFRESNKPIVEPPTVIGSEFDEFKRYGLVCEMWTKEPQTICYVARYNSKNSAGKNDYLYLIGGDTVEIFDPKLAIEKIMNWNKLIESTKADPSKKIPNDINTLYNQLTKDENIWKQVSVEKIPEDTANHSVIKNGFYTRALTRTIHGVFNYFNYLVHAHKHLNLTNIYEVNGDTLGKTVKIIDLIRGYEPVYNYCKNRILYK